MALIDVITWDGGEGTVSWKFPSTNLRLGSQLIVKPDQVAFFVYRGKVCDEVAEGAITLIVRENMTIHLSWSCGTSGTPA